MIQMKLFTLYTLALLGFTTAHDYDVQPKREVEIQYITDKVQRAFVEQPTVYKASTCKKHIGDTVNITVTLFSNPLWSPLPGVVYFYVVDAEDKDSSKALCTNHEVGKPTVPYCTVPNWNSSNDLFVYARAGYVQDVSFGLSVEFIPKTEGKTGMTLTKPRDQTVRFQPTQNGALVYLNQIAEIFTDVSLVYGTSVELKVPFCPDSRTTSSYEIVSSVIGSEVMSSFTQYICDTPNCTLDSPNVIIYNSTPLRINVATIKTSYQEFATIYVVVTGWGGTWNPAAKEIIGKFRYSANISPM
ncbi:uncharacterized protein LOC144440311 [Glandiceps talaboti]